MSPSPTAPTASVKRLLDVSTAHIPRHTALALGEREPIEDAALYSSWSYDRWAGYGWILWVGELAEYPDVMRTQHSTLVELLDWARQEGADYLKLDCDAPVVTGLPTFDW